MNTNMSELDHHEATVHTAVVVYFVTDFFNQRSTFLK